MPDASAAQPAPERVLCVDDDPNILEAFERQFRNRFALVTAASPDDGLEAVSRKGPFAVVVSDLRMPGMTGIQFLAAVRTISPNTVRIMLTGHADLPDAVQAVNQGGIFRLLLKPSSATVLGKVIEAGIDQYHLVVAEQELTQKTLLGCVEVLTEVLSIVEPRAFSRSSRLRRYVGMLARLIGVTNTWRFEAAALLSQVGWISLPSELCTKVAAREELTPPEATLFAGHPAAAARILARIPRLAPIARMIGRQLDAYDGPLRTLDPEWSEEEAVHLGAALLRLAIDFDNLRQQGQSLEQALVVLRSHPQLYRADLLAAMITLVREEIAAETHSIRFEDLREGMVLEEEICNKAGVCLVSRGQPLSATVLDRLRNGFYHHMTRGRRFLVRVPKPPEPEPPPRPAGSEPAA
jgi:response regulator RpfG family c-di-GMP phosphodiesterase